MHIRHLVRAAVMACRCVWHSPHRPHHHSTYARNPSQQCLHHAPPKEHTTTTTAPIRMCIHPSRASNTSSWKAPQRSTPPPPPRTQQTPTHPSRVSTTSSSPQCSGAKRGRPVSNRCASAPSAHRSAAGSAGLLPPCTRGEASGRDVGCLLACLLVLGGWVGMRGGGVGGDAQRWGGVVRSGTAGGGGNMQPLLSLAAASSAALVALHAHHPCMACPGSTQPPHDSHAPRPI